MNFSILRSHSSFLNGCNTYLAQNYGNCRILAAENAWAFYFKILLFEGKKSLGVLRKYIKPKKKNFLYNSGSPLIL